jgi:hypothetical protein
MADPNDDFAKRAAARATWPGRKTSLLVSRHEEDLSETTTIEERLGMMWELAAAAWSLTGTPAPDYVRSQMPGRIIRPTGR